MTFSLVPPSPLEMGFPEKFTHWRGNQPEIIEKSFMCEKRFDVGCAPVGSGKSQCYISRALLEGTRTVIVTANKGLEDQLMADYSSIGLVNIRGKANYECNLKPGWTCQDGHAHQCPSKGTVSCPYTKAYNRAKSSKLVVTNYKYWMAVHKYGTGLGTVGLLVLDEAHESYEELADSLQVRLSRNEAELVEYDFPPPNSDGKTWKAWASKTRTKVQGEYTALERKIRGSRDAKPTWIKDMHHLKNLVQKLAVVALMNVKDWIWEEFEWGWQFDPIVVARYSESRLFLRTPKVMMVSATVRPKTMYMLGVKGENFEFTDHPSIFDPKRSPIYYVPTMRVDSKVKDLAQLYIRLDQFIRKRYPDPMGRIRNGIIQVTSFEYRNRIIKGSGFGRDYAHGERMLSHWDGEPVAKAVAKFKEKGGILISPSVGTGYNFPGDECRWQFHTKIPFPVSVSKIVKARQDRDPDYSMHYTVQELVQATGRGNRSEEDWCEDIVADDHMKWFYRQLDRHAPKAFLQRYKAVNVLPPPMQVQ